MKKPQVAITIRSFDTEGPAMELLRRECEIVYLNQTGLRLSEDGLIKAIGKAEYIIAGTERFSKKVIESSPGIRGISRVGVGIENIDKAAAEQAGIQVLNTPDAPVQSVAEHTFALIMATLKHIPEYNARMRNHDYSIQPGSLLAGKTVGIVGMGRIGSRVASLLHAFGCKILYYDPYRSGPVSLPGLPVSALQDLVIESDIISIHAAPSSDGSPLFTEKIFNSCKKGCIIINTSRGSLINERALEDAILGRTVSAAGLDVFQNEPYDGPLLKYPQVIVTPHISSNTNESRQQMEMEAVRHIIELKKEMVT